jgi:DNA polymerase III delta subunit
LASADELKPAYLLTGTDEAKIVAALARLRDRAEREGGAGGLQSFAPVDGQGPPDVDGFLAALPAMSLMPSRRYLVVEGLERLDAAGLAALTESLDALPPDLTVVLVWRGPAPTKGDAAARARAKGLAELQKAVPLAGGEVLSYSAPSRRELPRWLAEEAGRRGFRLEADAARMLMERMGEGTIRLANELDRLALWAGDEGAVSAADLAAMIADTSEEAAWALSDAILARDVAGALAIAERLAGQGEATPALVYHVARRLRDAEAALTQLEAGRPAKEVEGSLGMHPYAARKLIERVRDASLDELRAATCAIADLEWWTRGGSEYPEEVALTLAVRRAAGATARA